MKNGFDGSGFRSGSVLNSPQKGPLVVIASIWLENFNIAGGSRYVFFFYFPFSRLKISIPDPEGHLDSQKFGEGGIGKGVFA